MPKPAVQSGGIKAVAIATPGMAFVCSWREMETMPAMPPNKAINTSNNVGNVVPLVRVLVRPMETKRNKVQMR